MPTDSNASRQNRRDFMKTTAAVGSAVYVSGMPAMASNRFAGEQINFACIGVEGKGSSDTDDAGRNAKVVALCDIDEQRLNKKATRYKDAQKFVDYREMLDEIGDKVDAVTVSTPDHSHAPAAAMALRMGKHTFCQKPLTWSINEARTLRGLAKEYGVCTQMGNQGTATDGLREGVEICRSGMLGDIKEVHIWTNRPVWPQGSGRPTETMEVPKTLHWDLFLGPAPERPYHSAYHPFKWRGWLDFGTGALGDMACHTANMAVMALDLFDAKTCVAEHSGIVENETYPKSSKITFQFAATENRPAIPLYWYDGGNLPPAELLQGEKVGRSGSLVVGTEGSLYSKNDYHGNYQVLGIEDFKKPEQVLPRTKNHFGEFIEAIQTNNPSHAMSNFNYASRLTETILLGNVALRAGSLVEWDGEKGEITNNKDANKFLGREYRDGWKL